MWWHVLFYFHWISVRTIFCFFPLLCAPECYCDDDDYYCCCCCCHRLLLFVLCALFRSVAHWSTCMKSWSHLEIGVAMISNWLPILLFTSCKRASQTEHEYINLHVYALLGRLLNGVLAYSIDHSVYTCVTVKTTKRNLLTVLPECLNLNHVNRRNLRSLLFDFILEKFLR